MAANNTMALVEFAEKAGHWESGALVQPDFNVVSPEASQPHAVKLAGRE